MGHKSPKGHSNTLPFTSVLDWDGLSTPQPGQTYSQERGPVPNLQEVGCNILEFSESITVKHSV